MVKEAGEDRGDQIKFIKEIMEDVEKLGQNATHTEASPDEGGVHQHKASKTQGTLPRAQKASPTAHRGGRHQACHHDKTGQGGSAISEHSTHWITVDGPLLELQLMGGERHQLQ